MSLRHDDRRAVEQEGGFDAIWNWSKTYMQHCDQSPGAAAAAWSAETNGVANDEMPAPDGEATPPRCFFAAERWGAAAMAFTIIRLKQMNCLPSCASVNPSPFNSRWVKPQVRCLNRAENGSVHPIRNLANIPSSYHLPAFYEVWARRSQKDREFWKRRSNGEPRFFPADRSSVTGLTPRFLAEFNGQPWGTPWNPARRTVVAGEAR